MRKVQFRENKTLARLGNFLRLDSFKLIYPKFKTDEMSAEQMLVNVHRGDAVAGLLHIVGAGGQAILLVEQFRMPTLICADDGLPDLDLVHADEEAGRMIELMAGMRQPGEPWLEAFRRECVEETHLEPNQTEYISSFYPSPGACSERIHLYYGRIDWPQTKPWPQTDADDAANFGDDNEDIRRHFVTPRAFLDMIEAGEIHDGKCLAAAEWMRRPTNMSEIFEL